MIESLESSLHSAEPIELNGYILRAPKREEIGWFVALGRQYDLESTGSSTFDETIAAAEWDNPQANIADDFRFVIDAASGQPVAYGELSYVQTLPVRPWGFGFVAPQHRGKGIGSMLVRWTIDRAKALIPLVPPEARVVLQHYTLNANTAAAALYNASGMRAVRASYVMMIDMDAPPPAPMWPDGISVTDLAETPDLPRFLAVRRDTFRDHRGFIESPMDVMVEQWRHNIANDAKHDPKLFVLAMDGDTPAGMCISMFSDEFENAGWIDLLGVMPDYRRRGLARALLHNAFGQFWERGYRSVGLSVDGASLTNAVALYEGVGMRIHMQHDVYELELRAGEELTPQ